MNKDVRTRLAALFCLAVAIACAPPNEVRKEPAAARPSAQPGAAQADAAPPDPAAPTTSPSDAAPPQPADASEAKASPKPSAEEPRAVTPLAPVKCEGGKYGVGDTWKRDCNTCTCQSGGTVACTEMLCPKDGAKP